MKSDSASSAEAMDNRTGHQTHFRGVGLVIGRPWEFCGPTAESELRRIVALGIDFLILELSVLGLAADEDRFFDSMIEFRTRLKALDVPIWGMSRVHGRRPADEANRAAEACVALDLAGWIAHIQPAFEPLLWPAFVERMQTIAGPCSLGLHSGTYAIHDSPDWQSVIEHADSIVFMPVESAGELGLHVHSLEALDNCVNLICV